MTKNESRRRIAHRDGSVGAPVDLRALAGSEVQLQIDRPLGRPDAADVIPQDRHATTVSFLAQTLEDFALLALHTPDVLVLGVRAGRRIAATGVLLAT